MSRCIDADALKKVLNEIFDTVEVVTFDDIIKTIDNAPTVEPESEIRWTDKLSVDAYGNIRDFNGNIIPQFGRIVPDGQGGWKYMRRGDKE